MLQHDSERSEQGLTTVSTFVPLTTEEELVSAHRAGLLVWRAGHKVSSRFFNEDAVKSFLDWHVFGILVEEDEEE